MAKNRIGGGWSLKGTTAQILPVTGARVNATAGAASTAEAALPTGATDLVIVRASGLMAIRFGTTGMGAAAIDANSVLFVAGEAPVQLPEGATHFRCIRGGSADAAVQLETVKMLASA